MRGCGDWECVIQSPEKVGSNGGCRCSRYKLETEIRELRHKNKAMLEVLEELDECAVYWSEYDVPLGIHDRIKDAIKKAKGEG